ncbi:MAG: MBOAT family protein [Elainella sp. Prado103]|jgi:D-alanyl-lipoteichoic acid acyltransferase DltB (MBOAT superfamily)|nr:MBOAT family protein [Elainella sp. Prado103]
MRFNSPEFIFVFLPIVLLGYWQVGQRFRSHWAIVGLIAASLVFYSLWSPIYLLILLGSILVNYLLSVQINRFKAVSNRRIILAVGIILNLGLLGYFKYTNFLLETLSTFAPIPSEIRVTWFPVGISFYTFQQIAYLVDCYRRESTPARSLLSYVSFATFFPSLISGPLLRFQQIQPQFDQLRDRLTLEKLLENLTVGMMFFAIGLCKKVVLADGVAPYANQVFEAAATAPLTWLEGWLGALAFTLQLYFDFSGYSDMAIGVARMFGIILPVNFDSPYQAISMIDFWRRWHITLSNFLRDYLYIPLGGNRKGALRQSGNLMLTMLIGGLWHGAGWNFVIWGGLHGIYLTINHGWRSLQRSWQPDPARSNYWHGFGRLVTFVAVVIGWVFFRAPSLTIASAMLRSMMGRNGLSLPTDWAESLAFLQPLGVRFDQLLPHLSIEIAGIEDTQTLDPTTPLLTILVLLLGVWFMPNSQQWLGRYQPTLESLSNPANPALDRAPKRASQPASNSTGSWWQWHPTLTWAIGMAGVTVVALLHLARVSEFLYFEF